MNKLQKRKIKLIISVLISFVILFVIYQRIDFTQLGQVFLHIDPLASAGFLVLIAVQLFIATWRWNILTTDMGQVRLPFFTSFEQVVGSYSANLVIPGKLGEIVRLPWMRKYSLKTPVILMVLFEKLLDIAAVIFILFISLLLLKGLRYPFPFNVDSIFYISAAFVLMMVLVFFFRKPLLQWMKGLRKLQAGEQDQGSFSHRMMVILDIIDQRSLTYFLISVFLWFIQVLQFYFIFLMVGIKASFFYIYSGSCLALLAGALPISVAGMGTRDAVIIGFFNPYAPMELLAGVGIISLLRIIIPALTGIPFFIRQTKES